MIHRGYRGSNGIQRGTKSIKRGTDGEQKVLRILRGTEGAENPEKDKGSKDTE